MGVDCCRYCGLPFRNLRILRLHERQCPKRKKKAET